MKITVLGSGTLQPTLKRGCSGYLLEIGQKKILLDAGSGTLRQLARVNVTADDIDFIFFTHLHIDHTADLVPLLFAKRHTEKSTKKDISLFGPPGFQRFFSQIEEIYSASIQPKDYFLHVRDYSEGTLDFKNFGVTFLPVKHTENSYGMRIEDNNGKILSYTGDTDYCDNLITLCRSSDVAIIECSFPDDKKVEGHLTPGETGKIAYMAGCKYVLLTHLYPIAEEENLISSCSEHFHGRITIAEELKTIVIDENL